LSSPLVQGLRFPLVNQEDERDVIRSLPASTGKTASDIAIADLAENGADSPFSILAGEDRMSSTAMESFTQAPDSFRNCFTCHNTQAVTDKGVPLNKDTSGVRLLEPKLLNVSHVLSQFILEECDVAANRKMVMNTDGTMITAVICP